MLLNEYTVHVPSTSEIHDGAVKISTCSWLVSQFLLGPVGICSAQWRVREECQRQGAQRGVQEEHVC